MLPKLLRSRLSYGCALISFAALYYLLGKLGLSFAFVHKSATPVWPPTGYSIALLILLGVRLWPAIFLGAFFTNFSTTGYLLSSLGIAIGNTAEALVGSLLIVSQCGGVAAFKKPKHVFYFALYGGALATILSPSIGMVSLLLDGLLNTGAIAQVWMTWWLGDMTGALVFAPLFILWGNDPYIRWQKQRVGEAIFFLMLTVILVYLAFGPTAALFPYPFSLAYLCIPLVTWTAFRFGAKETSASILFVSIGALYHILTNHNALPTPSLNASLLLLQTFLAVLSISGLAVAASIGERNEIEAALKLREKELSEADRHKDEFLAMLAHELRNLLAAILSASQLGKRERGESTRIDVNEVIGRQVRHLTRLIEDLLDVSRITKGKVRLIMEHVELNTIIEEAIQSVRHFCDSKKLHLRSTNPGNAVYVRGDRTRLEQMVVNLLLNAIKYTDSGGIIEISVVPQDTSVSVAIHDSGIGMSEELKQKIFEPFVQGERSLDRSLGGLGIGLTLVKRLVELHGGTIEVASEGIGKGSTFTLTFPRVSVEENKAQAKKNDQPAGKHQSALQKILIVDDNEDAREALALLLEDAGYEVSTVQDGRQALDAVTVITPDIVLLDLGLPGMDGFTVAEKIRSTTGIKQPVVVAISGYGSNSERTRSLESGIDCHCLKPIDIELLLGIIRGENFEHC